jgi:hypothetical protein
VVLSLSSECLYPQSYLCQKLKLAHTSTQLSFIPWRHGRTWRYNSRHCQLYVPVCTDSPKFPLAEKVECRPPGYQIQEEGMESRTSSPAGFRRTFHCLVTTPTELTGAQCSTNPNTKLSNNMNVKCYYGLPRNVMVRTYWYLLTKILGTEHSQLFLCRPWRHLRGVGGEWWVSSSGRFTPGFESEAGKAIEPVWTIWRTKTFVADGNRIPACPIRRLATTINQPIVGARWIVNIRYQIIDENNPYWRAEDGLITGRNM